MRFRILGPLRVIADNRPVELGGRRQRTLLAVLLANSGQLVPLDYLVDAVWDDRPPSTAKRQVQNRVAVLRRILGPGAGGQPVIVTDGPGYRLIPGEGELDAEVFAERVGTAARLAEQGRPGQASAELRSALGLWHGPALFGLSGRAVEAAAAGLEEQRLAAHELCFELELGLGRHDPLVAEIAELVAAHPLREKLVGQLVLALHRAGRQAEALQAYHRLRVELADQLGVDPGTALQKLYLAILANDPPEAKASVVPVPAQLPAGIAGFTGRREQLRKLDEVLSGAGRSAVVIAAITGTAGVGKTTLAVHWAHRVRDRFPDGQLYLNLRGYAADAPMDPVEALAHLLSGLGRSAEQIPPELQAAAGLYRSLLADRRVLVVLDNAVDADQVRPLLPGTPGCLVLVTSRDRLSGLLATDGAQRLTLDVLSDDESTALLARVLGPERVAAEPKAASALGRACSRLPLALRVAAANLADNPGASIAEHVAAFGQGGSLAALEIDGEERVRRTFDLSYQALDGEVRRLFRWLGLVPGPDVTAAAAAALTATTERRAAQHLNRLAAAHLVDQHAPGRFGCHDLLREFAADRAREEDSVQERSAALHRLYDWYLHNADVAAKAVYPHRLRLPVPQPQDPSASFEDHHAALAWFDTERANLVAAIRSSTVDSLRPVTWLLADTLRGYLQLRMHLIEWAQILPPALAAAEAEGDPRAQAAIVLSAGDLYHRQSRYRQAITSITRALTLSERAGWLQGQAAALGYLGTARRESGQLQAAAACHERALVLYRELGSLYGEAVTLDCLGRTNAQLGRLEEAHGCYLRSLALYREIGSRQGQVLALHDLGEISHGQGRLDAATDYLTRALHLAQEIGDACNQPYTMAALASVRFDAGQRESAAELARAAVDAADGLGDPRGEAVALNSLGSIEHRLGHHAEAIEHHRRVLDLVEGGADPYPQIEALLGLAVTTEALGLKAEATRHAQRARTVAGELGFAILGARAEAILDRLGASVASAHR